MLRASCWGAAAPRTASLPLTFLPMTLISLPLFTRSLVLAMSAKCCRFLFLSHFRKILTYIQRSYTIFLSHLTCYMSIMQPVLRDTSCVQEFLHFVWWYYYYGYLGFACIDNSPMCRSFRFIKEEMLWAVWCTKQMQEWETPFTGALVRYLSCRIKFQIYKCSLQWLRPKYSASRCNRSQLQRPYPHPRC